jgi:hypothetical protein
MKIIEPSTSKRYLDDGRIDPDGPTINQLSLVRATWLTLAGATIVTACLWALVPDGRWCDCFGLASANVLLMALGASTKERGCWS